MDTTELNELLGVLKRIADPLIEAGVDPDIAYLRAVGIVARRLAEAQAMTPFEARLVEHIHAITAQQGGRPASVTQIALAVGMENRFTVHFHLRRLEERGLITRPRGPKSGWVVAA